MQESTKRQALTSDEVSAALIAMTSEDHKRLVLYGHHFRYTGWEPEDLIHEAIKRLLEETRACPEGIPVLKIVSQVMRSIASEIHEENKKLPTLELVLSHSDTDGMVPDLAVDPITPERILLDQEDLTAVLALFDADVVGQTVAEGIMVGMEGADLCSLADISPAELATVRRRVSRHLQAAFPRRIVK